MPALPRHALFVAPLLAGALAGALRADPPPADKPTHGRTRPALVVEARHPGADARAVYESIAAPLEQQLKGLENVRYLRSRCTDDGRYALVIACQPDTDLAAARKAVREQIDRTLPSLVDAVRQSGVTVADQLPGPLAIVSLASPDHTRDALFLSNMARSRLLDRLARLPGVARATVIGASKERIRIWLDPDRLAARDLTPEDVVRALRARPADKPAPPKVQVDAGVARAMEHFARIDALEKAVVKTDAAGQIVRLNDVARVELGADSPGIGAFVNDDAVVLVAVTPTWQASLSGVLADVRDQLAEVRRELPNGLDLDLFCAFNPAAEASAALALVDVTVPAAASAERTRDALRRACSEAREVAGVRRVLALTENPFDRFGGQPCLLIQAAADGARTRADVRASLAKVPDLQVRLRDGSGLGSSLDWNYPIGLALHGPDTASVLELADKLAQQLRQSEQLSDVSVDPTARPQPRLQVDIDRKKCSAMGVEIAAVNNAVKALTTGRSQVDTKGLEPILQVQVVTAPADAGLTARLREAKVRNADGQLIPLPAVAAVRQVLALTVLDGLDGKPMVEITANLAPGVSPAQARSLCERLFRDARKDTPSPAEFGLTWLRDMPVRK